MRLAWPWLLLAGTGIVRAVGAGGERESAALLARVPERSPDLRHLASWLSNLCERRGLAKYARGYNELLTAWHAIETASHETGQMNMQGSFDV